MSDLFAEADEDERAYRRAEAIRNAGEAARVEAAEAAGRQERLEEFGRRANAGFLKRGYEEAGVEPPFVDANGNPTCSLALLLSMGWRVEEIEGRNVLTQGVRR